MLKFSGAVAVALVVNPIAAIAQAGPPVSAATGDLHERAQAALPAIREALDGALTDYPSARFRGVQARLVRSVYSTDEGQSNKVPWAHRGGVVLVFCGEINAKNRMGGYSGWEPFGIQPAQIDVVVLHQFDAARTPKETNLAEQPKFMSVSNLYDEHLALMCGSQAELIDPTDLAEDIAFRE